jgi:dipeptidyl-peptidase-3
MKRQGLLLGVIISQLVSFVPLASGNATPLPVKKKFTISNTAPLEFLWSNLSEKEKKLAFHLQNAARAGRDLLFFQSHRHALLIKATFEEAFNSSHFNATQAFFGGTEEGKKAFQELMLYFAQFEDQGGPYATSNRKYILSLVTPDQVIQLFKKYAGGIEESTLTEVVKLLTDPQYEVIRRPEDPSGSDLILAGGNIYQTGLMGEEIQQAINQGLKIDLNCQVVKEIVTQQIECMKMTVQTPGKIGTVLSHVVQELEQAIPFATTDHQKKQIESTIQYFITGDQEDFRQASIEWVKDGAKSTVDFMMGFVEVYDDYKGNVGTWESYVQIADPKMTQISQLLAKSAQHFENSMPYGQWKKVFPENYSPPALMVYYFQEIAGMRSGGYNLPNFDDIRRDVGAKNIIRLPMPGELENPERKLIYQELYQTFGRAEKVDHLVENFQKQRQVVVLLHEIIGHGSGTYDTQKYAEKEDPISALGSLGSALEEQRADLTALVFAADPKLVKAGIYKTDQEALVVRDAMYDIYLIDFMRWIGREQSFAESHMRGHWLLINALLQKGAIAWENQDASDSQSLNPETQILVVKDYMAFHEVCLDLLAQLQDIKANRKVKELEVLFKEKAPLDEIQKPWAQAMIKRGENLRINSGTYEQSWIIDSSLKFKAVSEPTLESVSQGWSKIGYTVTQ